MSVMSIDIKVWTAVAYKKLYITDLRKDDFYWSVKFISFYMKEYCRSNKVQFLLGVASYFDWREQGFENFSEIFFKEDMNKYCIRLQR